MSKLEITPKWRERLAREPEKLKMWVEALRSDKYTQAWLKMTGGGMSACCLCVLECEAHDLEPADYSKQAMPPIDRRGKLPPGVKFDGVFASNIIAYDHSAHDYEAPAGLCPAVWNDELGLSFHQIADLLETGEVEYEVEP